MCLCVGVAVLCVGVPVCNLLAVIPNQHLEQASNCQGKFVKYAAIVLVASLLRCCPQVASTGCSYSFGVHVPCFPAMW
jgi:hypothetical protein